MFLSILFVNLQEVFNISDKKKILLVYNVISLASPDLRIREHREIDTMIDNGRYSPSVIVTEPVSLRNLGRFFKKKSFEDKRVEVFRLPNIVIDSLTSNRLLSKSGRLMFGLSNIFFQSVYLLHLFLLVLSLTLVKKINLIHSHNPPDLTGFISFFVSKITRTPFVHEIHDRAPELYCGSLGLSSSSLVFKIMKILEYLVVVNCNGLITVNTLVAKYFKQFGGPIPISIPTGFKLDVIKSSGISFKSLKLQDKKIILYQGTLNLNPTGEPSIYDLVLPLKALPHILENIPNAILVYVGAGVGRPILETKAKTMALSNKVIFTGYIPQKEVFEWIKIADVVLIPYADNSNSRSTIPTKLFEYMAFGKPIVATRFPGILEVIDNNLNGLVYTVNSVSEFSNCVQRILNNPKLAKKLSMNIQSDFISKYSSKKLWSQLIPFYDSIIINS